MSDDFFPLNDDFERILAVLEENYEEYSQYVSELDEDVSWLLQFVTCYNNIFELLRIPDPYDLIYYTTNVRIS